MIKKNYTDVASNPYLGTPASSTFRSYVRSFVINVRTTRSNCLVFWPGKLAEHTVKL